MTIDDAAEPWQHWLSKDQLLEIHDHSLVLFGGLNQELKPGCLEASLNAAFAAEHYDAQQHEHKLPGLQFAGSLLFALSKNHCFADGNKRIAWAAAMATLARLGLTVSASDDEATDFCLAIARSELNKAEVIAWLGQRLCALKF